MTISITLSKLAYISDAWLLLVVINIDQFLKLICLNNYLEDIQVLTTDPQAYEANQVIMSIILS